MATIVSLAPVERIGTRPRPWRQVLRTASGAIGATIVAIYLIVALMGALGLTP